MANKTWTKEKIDKFVEKNGGETLGLLSCFTFSENSLKRINEAYEDEENYTDSDVCDLILELAYEDVSTNN